MLHSFYRPMHGTIPDSFERLQDELNHSLVDFRNGLLATQGALSLNIWQNEDEVLVRLELPGVTLEQIQVNAIKDQLLIKAERQQPENLDGEQLKQERTFGSIERTISVPFLIDHNRTEATFRKGVLELKLHAVPEESAAQIEVTAGE